MPPHARPGRLYLSTDGVGRTGEGLRTGGPVLRQAATPVPGVAACLTSTLAVPRAVSAPTLVVAAGT